MCAGTELVGGALILYAARAGAMEAKGVFSMISRESALVANNILLAVAALVVFTGALILAGWFLSTLQARAPPV